MKTILGLALVFGSSFAIAEQQDVQSQWSFSANLSQVNLDSKQAALEGVGDSAWSIDVSANYIQNNWISSFGLGYLGYDDEQEFSQVVEGTGLFNDGDISVNDSSASAVTAFVATGYQWQFVEQGMSVITQAGYTHLFASERGIDNCSNCYDEDIEIDGGIYAKVSAQKDFESFSLGLYFQQYLTGDIENATGLLISSSF
ncbi:hypothetical protein [Microbulbifer spongiae]|uniref:Outer membrane protein beta-barrel domain-containing protein n=1 Tax=Microbulbifer spongiae TaxID=2944933 RepID=A0ABY9E9Y2_9GAMM|nr:hypothetical protein [Microbulbifer sp. MI-G]WKD49828.1 hypothetical protein M8T91_18380 [Microbulbifer sp. MI-G]